MLSPYYLQILLWYHILLSYYLQRYYYDIIYYFIFVEQVFRTRTIFHNLITDIVFYFLISCYFCMTNASWRELEDLMEEHKELLKLLEGGERTNWNDEYHSFLCILTPFTLFLSVIWYFEWYISLTSFGTSDRRCSRLPFRQLTGNTVSGHYFCHYFLIFCSPLCTFHIEEVL